MAIFHTDHNKRLVCGCGCKTFHEKEYYSYVDEKDAKHDDKGKVLQADFLFTEIVCSYCGSINQVIYPQDTVNRSQ